MNKILYKTIIFLVFFTCTAYSEESKTNLFLIENNNSYLSNYYNNSVFDDKIFSINITNKNNTIKNTEDMQLKSNIININSQKNIQFQLFFPVYGGKKMVADWNFPEDDNNIDYNEEVLNKTLGFAKKSASNDPAIVFSEFSKKNNLYDIEYDYDKSDYIKSYSFSIKEQHSQNFRFWRTVSEITLFSALGEANYWITKDENVEDWEYKPSLSGFRKKITDGWSLDTNNFRTNTIYHAYAGALYYQSARSNGYGYLESTMFSFFGSLMWEYVGEFREQVSTNDMIWTPFAGSVMGEGMRQLSIFTEENMDPGFFRNLFMFTLDPMRIVNEYMDSRMNNSFRVRLYFESPVQKALQSYAEKEIIK